ncbi:hypothetical protein RO3G_11071 [Lichtheimia corymbifera JMRC:FSU:9682]|uniref:SH3 domain-containing protein n=1 Tax=Lichtheimia corymbifera JMRC:FSU:9682 TaxID=1263082 RepID=A0A068RVX2_9FUNG|nr:hypothetical protein RO3G_11071 [Lichtheimia corymbifera JMRC:FSU:9682]
MSFSTEIPIPLLVNEGNSKDSNHQSHDSVYNEGACYTALDCSISTTTTTTESEEREEHSTAPYSFDVEHPSELELPDVYARDFAYPEGTSLHYGIVDQKQHHQQRRDSQVSLSSPDFTGCQARALYDFVPETEYEIGMNEGDIVWVQYRQCPGWLVADVQNETGLVPESYVDLL